MSKPVRFIPPNPIADLVERKPGTSAEELCSQADTAMEQAKAPLFQELETDAERLKLTYEAILADRNDRDAQLETLHALAFEMKGLGGLFGYPVVSIVSELLLKMTDAAVSKTEEVLEVIGLQVDAIALIIRERRDGEVGESDQALIASLRAAMEKVAAPTTR
jgi:hypothetical protein